MFYSHTSLARKGPLATVWIAAHLQHKLRKSHVTVTNISSTVDRIMFPEVPIALRLSGHLLLGVVRIYSRKVDYLYRDCNEVLSQMRTMFASVLVNLPEDADRATFQAVTLPDTLELDALVFDTISQEEAPDNHLKALEQITLPDQIPIEGEPYVAFFINEDRFDSPPQTAQPNISAGPMDEDILPQHQGNDSHDPAVTPICSGSVRSPHPSDAEQNIGNVSPVEIARNVAHNFGLDIPEINGLEDNILEPHGRIDQSKNNDGVSPTIGQLPNLREESPPSLLPENSPAVASLDASVRLDPGVSPGGLSLGMKLQPSPPVGKQNVKSRKRRGFYDKSIVLTNAKIEKQLQDTSKIVRKRRKLPCSTLDFWKFHKNMHKDQMFNEPLLSGMCTKLQEISERVFPAVMNGFSPNTMHEMDVEMEHARDNGMQDQTTPEPMPSPIEGEDCTPIVPSNPSVPKTMIPTEFEMPSRMEVPTSAEQVNHRADVSSVYSEEPLPPEVAFSPEVPGLLNSPEEDLIFLEAENTPSGYETRGFDSMSSRTRLVAHYFKEQSPMTQFSNNQSGHLSLNKILEGKTRKQCARMFFETLVLKSCDLIDVDQEEAYADISVSLTPTLSKLAI